MLLKIPPQSKQVPLIPDAPAEMKAHKQQGFQEQAWGAVTKRNSGRKTKTNCQEIPRPVAVPPFTATEDSPTLRDLAQSHALAELGTTLTYITDSLKLT